ncbi:hypothetical protein VTK56DRAFT_7642 [Thermocarpiscus australiensis]
MTRAVVDGVSCQSRGRLNPAGEVLLTEFCALKAGRPGSGSWRKRPVVCRMRRVRPSLEARAGSEVPMLAIPRSLRMPPSGDNIRLVPSSGAFVGMSLKSRLEICSTPTGRCSGASERGAAVSLPSASTPGTSGTACGSCLGDIASENRGGRADAGGNDCGKAKFSRPGSDVPRFSSIRPAAEALGCPAPSMLRHRSIFVVLGGPETHWLIVGVWVSEGAGG